MYPSIPQIVTSLERLSGVHPFFGFAFLGFKKARLPVGSLGKFQYSFIRDEILDPYFRFEGVKGYLNPFKSTKRWVSERYDSTSLQRVIADTFGSAFVREPESQLWGWIEGYVSRLKSLRETTRSERVPLFDIAVWYCRNIDLGDVSDVSAADAIVKRFINDFRLCEDEIEALFEDFGVRQIDLDVQPASEKELLSFIGYPPEHSADVPVSLSSLALRNVGPFRRSEYRASRRLNVIAGDNSLGKTFLLELIWWSLTGEWTSYRADPQFAKERSEIEIRLNMSLTPPLNVLVPFSRLEDAWQRPAVEVSSCVLYFAFDGGVHISLPSNHRRESGVPRVIRFDRRQLWQGHSHTDVDGRSRYLSNGLLQDITLWQLLEERYPNRMQVFEKALRALSPPEGRPLRLGKPTRIRGDSREIPTVRMPYGEVAFFYLSAGIQKAISMAYVLVWTLFEFLGDVQPDGEEKTPVVILLDEIEAHLHPKWQRRIVPALLAALEEILPSYRFQIHMATHSPLVMASLESDFTAESDSIHVMTFEERDVSIITQPFTKHGSVNSWLESDVFGLGTARSKPAEDVLASARTMMSSTKIELAEIIRINERLRVVLPEDDSFWVRWNRFFEFHQAGRR